jgi:hypothetical protein
METFTLGTSVTEETFEEFLPPGDGLLIVALFGVFEDYVTSMALSWQSPDFSYTNSGTSIYVNYYSRVTSPHQYLTIYGSGGSLSSGEIYLYRVQGARGVGANGNFVLQTSFTFTPQSPKANALMLVCAAATSGLTGLGQNNWKTLAAYGGGNKLHQNDSLSSGTVSFTSDTGVYFELVAKEKVRKQRFVTVRDPVVAQPQEDIDVDWDNEIAQKYKLVAAVRYAPNGQVLVSERGTNGRGRTYRDSTVVVGPVTFAYPTRFGTAWATSLQESQYYYGGYDFVLGTRYAVACVGQFYSTNNNETSNGQYIVNGGNFIFSKQSYATTLQFNENGGTWYCANYGGGDLVYLIGRDVSSTSNPLRFWISGQEQTLTGGSPSTTTGIYTGAVGSGAGNRLAGFADVIRYYFAEAPDVWLARELYDNPWQLLKPRERRIHIPAPVVTHKRKRLL